LIPIVTAELFSAGLVNEVPENLLSQKEKENFLEVSETIYPSDY
jgi:hypothetical protein